MNHPHPLGPWAESCPTIPDGYTLPDGYHVDHHGIHLVRETKDGEQLIRVTYAPVLPIGVYIDPAGRQMLELIWPDRNHWINRIVPRSTTKSGRKLIATLGDDGFPAVDGDARHVERWLAAVEACNHHTIPRKPLARWLGWQPDGTFVTTATGQTRVEPAYDDQTAALAAHRPKGTLTEWQTALKALDPYPVAKICVYAGLAAPLLHLLDVDSFTIDISGRSTRGKTTAAKLALSAWADPAEKSDGLFSWRTTLIAVEKRLNLCRGLPVVLDETRVVKFPELVDQVLYQVPKNHGQARGGGWPSLLPWSVIVISTGEQSALSFTSHQGAAARVLSITRTPFSGGTDDGPTAADVGKAVDAHHGHAGPAFITHLAEHLTRPDGRTELRDRHHTLTTAYRGTTDMTGRRAPMLACLILAAELAHQWNIVPFQPIEPQLWAQLFTTAEPTDNRPEMALDIVRELVASRMSDLWEPGRTATPPGGWIGRRITIDGHDTVAILPERLRDALKRAGYHLDAVLPGWQELGYLTRFGDGRDAYRPTKRIGDGKPRVYVFALGTIIEAREDGPGDGEPQHEKQPAADADEGLFD